MTFLSDARNIRTAAFGLLFAVLIALGVYAAHFSSDTITWREIDAHYAQGPDQSTTQYDAAFCTALAQSLRLNPHANAIQPDRTRIPLAGEYARHCEAP